VLASSLTGLGATPTLAMDEQKTKRLG